MSGLQLPATLKLEPMKYASGVVEERAGATLPDTSVLVLNGQNKRMTSTAGKKGAFTIVQRLWRLEGAPGAPPVATTFCSFHRLAHCPLDFQIESTASR